MGEDSDEDTVDGSVGLDGGEYCGDGWGGENVGMVGNGIGGSWRW